MASNPKGYMGDYYRKNKEKFNNPSERAKRAARNRARRKMTKENGEAAMKGKEVDHIKPLSKGGSNGRNNLRLLTAKQNRERKKK